MKSGNTYGRLKATERVGTDEQRHPLWRFVCECGNELVARAANVRNGNTTSCGCDRVDRGRDYFTAPQQVRSLISGIPSIGVPSWYDVHGTPADADVWRQRTKLYREDRPTFDRLWQGRMDMAYNSPEQDGRTTPSTGGAVCG